MEIIEGLKIIPLKKIVNQRGHLLEVQRNDDPFYPGFGQAYITCTLPGVVKAWYRHYQQLDQIALIKGELTLVFYDSRKDSQTFQNISEVVISEAAPALVQIPPRIWHGFKALGSDAAYLLHLNSAAFEFTHPDEDRLPSSTPSIPYEW